MPADYNKIITILIRVQYLYIRVTFQTTMHTNSNGTTGFLREMSFVCKFGKTAGLSLHYTGVISLQWYFQGKMCWTGARLAYCVQTYLKTE